MAVQTILQGDIPELRQTSSPIVHFDNDLTALLQDLSDTLTEHRGLALSAPQIGVLQRVFVVDLGLGIQEFINPEFAGVSGEMEGYESCLSFPGHTFKITRPNSISVKAQDRTGNPIHMEATDLLARILCHEIDHLNGVLFMDHLSEDEMLSQLLGNALDFKEEDETELAPHSDPEQKAQQQELQFVTDMLAELTWKLTLSLEILKDYPHLLNATPIQWNKLENIAELLNDTVQVVEDYASSFDG